MMRTIIYILYLFIGISFIACRDNQDELDEKKDLNLTLDYLNNSEWTGHYYLEDINGNVTSSDNIEFIFYDKEGGHFTIIGVIFGENNKIENFNYSVKKNRLILTNDMGFETTTLGEGWFVVEKDNSFMKLIRGAKNQTNARYLYLNRKSN